MTDSNSNKHFHALLVVALLLRVFFLPLEGTEDVLVWKTWSYGAVSQGVTTLYGIGGSPPVRGTVEWGHRHTTVDYPPLALYEIAAAGALYSRFVPDYRDSRLLTAAIKLPIVLADAALAAVLFLFLLRRYEPRVARFATAAYWLNPSVVLAGAALGYLDALAALPAVAAVLVTERRPGAGGALLAAAVLTKLQAIFLAPVVFLAVWNNGGHGRIRRTAAAVAGAALAAAAITAPVVIRGAWANMQQGVSSLLRHDMLSGNAANLWWLVTYAIRAAYATPELGAWTAWTMKVRILAVSTVVDLGYPSPRVLGTIAAAGAAVWILWRARRVSEPSLLLATGALLVHAYFSLAAQVHENHLFLAIPLLAGAAAVRPRLRPILTGVSAVLALNLFFFYGLGREWPVPPRNVTGIDATVLLSAGNLALLAWHARRFSAECASHI